MHLGPLGRKQLGYIVLAGGALVVLLCALAEPLGIGSGGGIHGRQIAGIVVGALAVLIGLWLAFGPEAPSGDAEAQETGPAARPTVAGTPPPNEPPPPAPAEPPPPADQPR
jgi:hypothetical protein